jgi:murein L,D-transpeptidase YafK
MRPLWLLIVLLGTLHQAGAANCDQADRIVVEKSKRILRLECAGKQIRTYKVALGGNPVGAKQRQGDHKTPEGHYLSDAKNEHSHFLLTLHVS